MKIILSFLLFMAATFVANAQNISVNNTGTPPDASAMLDISSSNKGLLIPRMTKTQRAAIATPKNGLIVYDSSTASFWFYKQNQWQELASNNSTSDSSLIYGQQSGSVVNYNLDATTHNTVVSDSSGFIYDSGGPGGNYGNNEDYAIAIYSFISNIIGYKVQVLNNNLENPFDTLSITYGGVNPVEEILTGTQTGTYTLDNSPIIIRFKSNASNTAAGFKIKWDVIFPPVTPASNAPMAGWYFTPGKLAMHGGYNFNNQWNDANSGFSSFNYGYGNKAAGDYSTALGYYTLAIGKYATALGRQSQAWGDQSIALGYDTYSSGNASTSFGNSTFAGGDYSTAFGSNTFASGYLSTAWGTGASSSGYNSTAFGSNTSASNNDAVAWGTQTNASGMSSTAFGSNTSASGVYSVAMGAGSIASGDQSMAFGSRISTNSMQGSFAMGDAFFYPGSLTNDAQNQMMMRFAGGYKFYLTDVTMGMSLDADGQVGIGTASPLAHLHVTDNSVLFSAAGNLPGSPASIPIQGAGRRSMWYADKAAFRAGYVDGTQWNQSNTGNYSFAAGFNTIASGSTTISLGSDATASGTNSIAIGESVTAKSAFELAVGRWNTNYIPSGTNGWSPTDRLFVIGNGTGFSATSDAMTVLKNGNIGIGTSTPAYTVSFGPALGDKISLLNPVVNYNYGFGVQSGLLQIHTDLQTADIAFGYGSSTSFTETMRIKGIGKVGISNSSPNAPLAFSNTTGSKISLYESSPNSQYGFAVQGSQLQIYSDAALAKISFGYYSSGFYTERMFLNNSTGVLTVNGTNYPSDARLKKDIQPLQNSLQKIVQLNGYTYHWKNEQLDNSLQTGVLAQEVQKLFPQLVNEDKDGLLSVNYSGLIPIMIESIKEQQCTMEKQQQKIDKLEKLVEKLLQR